MMLSILFAIAWLHTDEPRYKDAFTKCVEATYSTSDLKKNVEATTDYMRTRYPLLSSIGPIGYAMGIKREFHTSSGTVTPIRNTVATYGYDAKINTGSIGLTWHF